MGSSYSVYVGPYIRCSTRTSPVMQTIKLCNKEGCRFSRDTNPMTPEMNFCPQCGSLNTTNEVEIEGMVRDDIDPSWPCEELTDRVRVFNGSHSDDGLHIFVPNCDELRRFSFDRWDPECGEIFRVRAPTLEQEMQWLETHFAHELLYARNLYGEDKVEVRWGILGEFR